jgi:hypothetical protein
LFFSGISALDIAHVTHRRIFIPSYYAAPVIIEAAEMEGELNHLRVITLWSGSVSG